MRGKGIARFSSAVKRRITPAYAGKSLFCRASHFVKWDHPRLCGEKILQRCFLMFVQGSPPPMRGKAGKRYRILSGCGITPAYAGKSTPSARLSAGT